MEVRLVNGGYWITGSGLAPNRWYFVQVVQSAEGLVISIEPVGEQ